VSSSRRRVSSQSESERWKGEAFLATTPEEVRDCAGSFYNQTLALGHVDFEGYDLPPNPRIAVVGSPCEIEGIKAMQARPWTWGSSQVAAIALTIALLCTKSFNYEKLMLEEIRDKRNVDLDQVGRVNIIRGKMIVQDFEGVTIFEEPIRDFHGAALKGCDECAGISWGTRPTSPWGVSGAQTVTPAYSSGAKKAWPRSTVSGTDWNFVPLTSRRLWIS
jgi:coenzyme F420 hydrogenase subunit beta